MTITAKYASICTCCNRPIRPGDQRLGGQSGYFGGVWHQGSDD